MKTKTTFELQNYPDRFQMERYNTEPHRRSLISRDFTNRDEGTREDRIWLIQCAINSFDAPENMAPLAKKIAENENWSLAKRRDLLEICISYFLCHTVAWCADDQEAMQWLRQLAEACKVVNSLPEDAEQSWYRRLGWESEAFADWALTYYYPDIQPLLSSLANDDQAGFDSFMEEHFGEWAVAFGESTYFARGRELVVMLCKRFYRNCWLLPYIYRVMEAFREKNGELCCSVENKPDYEHCLFVAELAIRELEEGQEEYLRCNCLIRELQDMLENVLPGKLEITV